MTDKEHKISWKIKTSLERLHCGAAESGMDKSSKGQRKLEYCDGELLPSAEGRSIE